MNNNLLYKIAITLLDGVGSINAKKLIAHCGGVKEVFEKDHLFLSRIPGVGTVLANKILASNVMDRAKQELDYISKEGVKTLFYLDDDYPIKLKNCPDSPALLYYKGKAEINNRKTISIVGTRNSTHYGKEFIAELLSDLKVYDPIVISGLALGIDVIAHKEAMKNGLSTIGVVAHGLDRIYPAMHRSIARNMQENGAVLTEYVSGTNADRERFPMRNRIVAGMSDAVIVVESAAKGGSMITANLANGYSRDVFAVPGRVNDEYSQGCNHLIRDNKAHLLNSSKELIDMLGWETKPLAHIQTQLFIELSPLEELIVELLRKKDETTIDEICVALKLPMSKISSTLLNMEFSGVVLSRPGKKYLLA